MFYVLKVYTPLEGWACHGVFDDRELADEIGRATTFWVYNREDLSLYAIEEWDLNAYIPEMLEHYLEQ
jgi:hypothetical protein